MRLFRCLALAAVGLILLPSISTARPLVPAFGGGTNATYLPLMSFGTPTANDSVPAYAGRFQYGLNPGYYGNGWDDNGIHQLCYDAGCRSARGSLPDSFLATWGPAIRVNTFAHMVNDLDFDQITVFLGQPRPDWQDTATYGGQRSLLWQGMDEPIWDSGENGTPINDANRFAAYVWQVVSNYGQFISFYEIINEPDYTTSDFGWAASGSAGNWWQNAPQPTDLTNLRAPVWRYIRLLRIAYAVVKRYDPSAYVTPGGLGYESFLDALLRYSDNPVDGTVTSQYPLTGGAYFDALSIHTYPQFGARHWNGSAWVPDRQSDKAVEVLLGQRASMLQVLADHGYDGSPYPAKPIIVTELNVARKQIGQTLGGETMQRNFTIKALVKAQQAGIRQIYWFVTGEGKNYDDPSAGSFDLMGFYENLHRDGPGQQKITPQGVANRTTFQQLYGWDYDAAATAGLALPATVDGAAFSQGAARRYVLWAKTTVDNSETASATITLPGSYDKVAWNGAASAVSGTNIALSGTPIFLTPR